MLQRSNRTKLREIVRSLSEAIEDESVNIETVDYVLTSSTCSKCRDYGDETFETIQITYGKPFEYA